MDGRIIEGVARHVHRLVGAAAGAEAWGIIILPLDTSTELILRSQEIDLLNSENYRKLKQICEIMDYNHIEDN